ncbi:DNA translocase FtsK [Staphylococcus gallinarum]|uniref:DNA translocase FtsK n=1 Tax=Staphylococcus gallinarum TaxID=1293 RepID=A0A380FJX1_STAGA|nr:DNA translocase FtsK [Staphylococcus gallinarum]
MVLMMIISNKRSQRRQKAKQQEKRESLLPQNNDVYERPKGKFRFPVDGLESEQAHKEQVDSEDKLHENTTEGQNSRRRSRRACQCQSSTSKTKNYARKCKRRILQMMKLILT